MTVSYKKSGPGGGAYYTNCMAADGSKSVDDYYAGSSKEPPGTWYVGPSASGERATALGIADGLIFNSIPGREDPERFATLVQGFNPESGEALVQNAGDSSRIALHDFTLSAPKSVSVVWSQTDEKTKAAIEKAQEKGARTFLDFMSSKSYSRRGKGGTIKAAAPLRGALFEHGSSREDDPQLHTHAVVLNVCERANGTTGALETMEMMRWQGAAASLYHAELAWGVRDLGFEIERQNNLFEVKGVPEDVREAFSQRRAQIVDAVSKELEARGLDPDAANASRGLLQKAAIETRTAKDELTREQLVEIWHERGKELGFTETEVNVLMSGDPAVELTQNELLEEARLAVREITETNAVFKEPALLTKVAVQLVGRASPAQILEAVERVKEQDLLATKSINKAGLEEQIFTTREMLVIERQMLQLADRKDAQHILTDVRFDPALDPEQLDAARHATEDENAVSVIEGTAGAGKTFTMAAISRAYESKGYSVTGLSGSWTAALNLKDAAQLEDGRAITGWLNDIRSGKILLTNKSLIIVDEAGMVGARDLKNVQAAAKEAGAKVILLGDTLQQKSIAAGDALRVIANQNGSSRLDVIRRQRDEADRTAVKNFFSGKAKEGLVPYIERDAVHLTAGADETNKRIVDDWQASRLTHLDESHLILAADKKSVRELNDLAHEARKQAGEIEEGALFKTMDCKKEDDRVEISVGDRVVFRTNEKHIDVYNRTQGTVERIEGDKLKIRTDAGLIEVDSTLEKWQHKDGGLALQHAYCSTTYSSQGLTVDRAFVKDSLSLYRENAGVAMSRHREECQLYIDKQVRYEAKMRETPADQWHHIKEFSDEECLARVGRAWSSEREKNSTLDFSEWHQAGARIDVAIETRVQNIIYAKELASSEIERIRQKSKLVDAKPLRELPFQQRPGYALPEPETTREAVRAGTERLQDEAIEPDVMREANKQGFLRFDTRGEPVFCGRRPTDGALVMTTADAEKKEDLRGRYPPILRGDPSRVDVVKNGKEALALWSLQDKKEVPRSTVIVSDGHKDALNLPHTRKLVEQAKTVERHDKKEDVGKEKIVEANKAAQAAQEEAMRRAAQAARQR